MSSRWMAQPVAKGFAGDVVTLTLWVVVLVTLGIGAGNLAFLMLGIDGEFAIFVLMVGLGTVAMLTPCARLIARLLPKRQLAGGDLVRCWTFVFVLSAGALWLALELCPLILSQTVQRGACLGIVGAPLAMAAAGWAVATGRHRRGFLADILQFAQHFRRHR